MKGAPAASARSSAARGRGAAPPAASAAAGSRPPRPPAARSRRRSVLPIAIGIALDDPPPGIALAQEGAESGLNSTSTRRSGAMPRRSRAAVTGPGAGADLDHRAARRRVDIARHGAGERPARRLHGADLQRALDPGFEKAAASPRPCRAIGRRVIVHARSFGQSPSWKKRSPRLARLDRKAGKQKCGHRFDQGGRAVAPPTFKTFSSSSCRPAPSP